MSAFCPNTRSKTLTPLVNCIVNDVLVYGVQNVQKTLLQFVICCAAATDALAAGCHILQSTGLRSVLFGAPQIWRNESGCWLLKKSHIFHVPSVRVRCLVERCRNRLTSRASPATADVTGAGRGITAVDLHSRIDKDEVCEAKLWDVDGCHFNRSTKRRPGAQLVANLNFTFLQVVRQHTLGVVGYIIRV